MQWVHLRIAFGVLLMGVSFVWLLSDIQASERANEKTASEYHQAPYCTPTSSTNSSLEPCIYTPVEVVEKDKFTTQSKHSSTTHYFVMIEFPNGRQVHSEIYRSLYRQVTEGSSMTAQTWRHKIRFLSFQNQWYDTRWNPDRQNGANGVYLFDLIFGEFFIAFSLWVYWYYQRKLFLKGAVPSRPTESEYPLVRDDD